MKIAYGISVYKDPSHLKRLINALNTTDVVFYIHVDKKVDIVPFIEKIGDMPNVVWIEERYNVQWGGWNQVRYQLLFLQEAFENNTDIERIFIITGQDYPLWSNSRIKKECADYPNRIWMIGQNLTKLEGFSYMKQFLRVPHLFRDVDFKSNGVRRLVTALQRKLFLRFFPTFRDEYLVVEGKRWDIYQASGYFSCPRDAGLYVLNVFRQETAFVKYFKYSFVPEELAVPTIVFNSVYASYAQKNNDVQYRGLSTLAALHEFVYSKAIKIFTIDDYEDLKKSGKMFCRKVETNISDSLVDRIENDRKLLGNS